MQFARTGKVTLKAFLALRTHALETDGTPMCRVRVTPWRGHAAAVDRLGPGDVTCSRCLDVIRVRTRDGTL